MLGKNISVVRRIGNSLGLIVPIEILRSLNAQRGDEVLFYQLPNGDLAVRKMPPSVKEKIIAF